MEVMQIATADKHHLAIVASEFSRIIGQGNHSMMDFLGERYDGEAYEYLTRQSHIKLPNTLLNMFAATTPTSLAIALPPSAGGQGFLSRVILVYGARKYKQVPRPQPFDERLSGRVMDALTQVYAMGGEFAETGEALAYSESLYDYKLEIEDSRFGYYAERRYSHLLKVAMCLCASRGSMLIEKRDYEEAHRILRATERGMPDALGEFGMNPLAQLKQEILEQLRATQGPVQLHQLLAMFHRDARSREIMEVLNDLIHSKAALLSQLKDGTRLVSAVRRTASTEDDMMSLLAER
jgi:hypothetical protein